MASIAAAVLKGTLGLLVKKGRGWVAEKLKDGDVADQKLRGWITKEMDKVNSKLDAIARSDLGASISFFKEGLVFLSKVLNTETSSGKNISHTATAAVNTSSLTEELKNLDLTPDLTHLDNSAEKEALSDARKRFDDARREATRAFNNEALTLSDRILAMAVRLMAIILEKVENPASALAACRSCLEELHLMPGVRENFTVEFAKGVKSKFSKDERRGIVSAVCQINRVIYDVTKMAGEGKELLLWPCVEIGGNERVDPLRDSRLAKMLRKLEMGDCSLAWSFGQEGDEKDKRLQSATSIATNTLGPDFFVADNLKRCIKVFDTTGKFLYSFRGLPDVASIATDGDDNIYVLELNGRLKIDVCVYDKQANFQQKFPVGYDLNGNAVRVKDDQILLVSVQENSLTPAKIPDRDEVHVCKKDSGELIGVLSAKSLKIIRDMTVVDDGRIMVLDNKSCVHVFSDITAVDDEHSQFSTSSKYLQKFPVAHGASAIAFHWMSGHVIIASKSPDGHSWVSIYSKDGAFERSIQLELEKNDNISAAAVTADGRICVCVQARDGKGEKIGKVLVL